MRLSRLDCRIFVFIAVGACSGIEYHFDPGVAPDWTRGGEVANRDAVTAVGLSPVTQDVARDRQRALNDAKSKIGQIVNSRVESVHRDFVAAGFMGAEGKTSSVQVQTVKVESMVELGEVKTLAAFRDEATKTQYIQIGVERKDWLSQVETKIQRGLEEFGELHGRSEVEQAERRIVNLLKSRDAGRALIGALKSKVAVAEALGSTADWRSKVRTSEEKIATIERYLLDGVGLDVQCKEPATGDSCSRLKRGVETFVHSLNVGKGLVSSADVLRIVVELDSSDEGESVVGKAVEYQSSSAYRVVVTEPGGRENASLKAERLLGQRFSRGLSRDKARKIALEVAGEDALAALRNKVRKSISLASD